MEKHEISQRTCLPQGGARSLPQGGARSWALWRPVFRTVCNSLKQRAGAAGSVWVACPAGPQGAELRVRRLSTEGGVSRERGRAERAAPRKGASARGNARCSLRSSCVLGSPRWLTVQGPARASSSPRAAPDLPEALQLAWARALLLAREV